ncbi:MAG: conjugal transfer protein TraX [Rhodocyclaceae bacterium]|nr:conjugal transfer protein TraX [Rhodocyclaceae bacterium]
MIARTWPASLRAPALAFTDGGLEAVKWLALACMLLDHVDKYLLGAAEPALFAVGRLALPLFGFALAYNLARPGALARGAYRRLLSRLAAFGALASPFFIALGGLGWGWWPLNIMFTLFVAAAVLWLLEVRSSSAIAGAIVLFLIGGLFVEFWWPALAYILAAWLYCRLATWPRLMGWIAAAGSLYLINDNLWALAALPILFLLAHVSVTAPRMRWVFYAFYPAHLAALWGIRALIS